MSRRRWSWPALAILVGGVSPTACARPTLPADTAVIASGADLEDIAPVLAVHPLTRQVHRHLLYVTLVRNDAQLGIVPYAARAWRWSADGRAVTLELEPTLAWHDGTPTTAHDVAFTLRAAATPATGSPRAAELGLISSVTVDGPHVLTLRFAAARTTLPQVLAELPIMPSHRWTAIDPATWRTVDASAASTGNGPMRLARRRRGEHWVFERNPAFPRALGGPTALARVIVAVVDEPTTKLAGLVSGTLHMAGVSPTMASLVARDSTLVLASPPVLFSTVLVMNATRAPFDDPRVRRALSRALHRQRLVDGALAGFGSGAGSAVPPGVLPGPVPAPLESVAEANALLDAAGWRRGADDMRQRNGTPLAVDLWTVGSGDLAIEQLVQGDLEAVGVRVRLRAQEFTALLAALRAPAQERAFDLALTGVPGDVALGHLEALLHSRGAGGALDLGRVHDATLDTLIDRARAQRIADARDAWRAVDARLDTIMPVVWLYHARGVQGLSRRLEGVTLDLRGELATVAQWRVAR